MLAQLITILGTGGSDRFDLHAKLRRRTRRKKGKAPIARVGGL
jgi:hypothetical protein